MSLQIVISHHTRYEFDRPASLSAHELRLKPAAHCRTPILAYSLRIEPTRHFLHWQQDAYGNFVARVSFPNPVTVLDITVELIADMTVINPFDFFIESWAEHYPFSYPDVLKQELAPFLIADAQGERLRKWVANFRQKLAHPLTTADFLVQINQAVKQSVSYLIRMEPGVQTPEETLAVGSGSCRDSAWLLVQALRLMGLAARFVSGYLVQLVADVPALDGPVGATHDFTDLHAWCEVYLPGAGWVGLDATSGLLAGEGHIPLAVSAVPASAAPIFGFTDLNASRFDVEMHVTRVHETARVTKPYTETQWQDINQLGQAIDEILQKEDVRLTQGGEPTFVAVDNPDDPQWNTAALGEQKWVLANELMARLRSRFTVNGIVHYGQGKWYPGEPLPRWALTALWRTDGKPLWQDSRWLADQAGVFDAERVAKFGRQLCQELAVAADYLIPAYENLWDALNRESDFPRNVDILSDSDFGLPAERQRLARLLRAGADAVVALVLPLTRRHIKGGKGKQVWQSSVWPLRHDRLYLLPGDSPAGLRLPLASLPWLADERCDLPLPPDPFSATENLLADYHALSVDSGLQLFVPEAVASDVIHTALVLEAREGFLYVFLPPMDSLESALMLLAAIERTAEVCQCPVRLEGYLPPRDARIQSFAITPDPGVIEVNIHPSADWPTLVTRTEILYEQAWLSHLTAEKFMLDGHHTGTGGGNHMTLGAALSADSPFLRRPDVLQSLITFWQHHPALSYLFSGQFVGPTSQAPRVDEARDDNVYELEIAFQQLRRQIPEGVENVRPWLVDRFLRHFLVDLTGNTHRAEFCIDKLYSPDSATGRLGLLELRAFEMPPHYRMSLVQALLLRGLVAHFWRTPYRKKLVHWHTRLHDQFMLPYFVAQDIRDVCDTLRGAGFAFDDAWFVPFIEFRFPMLGSVHVQGMRLELRQAIEPWHVLGEEMHGGGTARYVDSSVERMEIRVSGWMEDRYAVVINGCMLPLHPTGVAGEFVAGLRYKAWAPASALHPGIGVQSPLVFDIVDRWNQRAVGGCTYHVSHPGGRAYDLFPVNANEAEARRRSRFWAHGHTPGTRMVPEEVINPRFPMTLDLRWQLTG